MKSVICTIKKLPTLGDEIRICYTASRGGMTEAAYKVAERDFWRQATPADDSSGRETKTVRRDINEPEETYVKLDDEEIKAKAASELAGLISRSWSGDLVGVKAKGDTLIITCAQDDLRFFPMVNGTRAAGEEYMSIEE